MTYNLVSNPDGTVTIEVSFADEGVSLSGRTNVVGDEAKALAYLSVFERDLRVNFAYMFPTEEPQGGELE